MYQRETMLNDLLIMLLSLMSQDEANEVMAQYETLNMNELYELWLFETTK